MKNLTIGDPHIRIQDIPEGLRLIDRVEAVAREEGIAFDTGIITFMGDLFHNHGIAYAEVMHFWRQALRRLSKICSVYLILGNHDGPQDMKPGVHWLAALEMPNVTIVDRPMQIGMLRGPGASVPPDGVWAVPFMRSNEEFVNVCQSDQLKHQPLIYCHQEFDGCKYDNGFYSKNGVDPAVIPQKLVISGHIHSGQEFGKVWYVGAPRWMIASDANQDRFLWVIEHNDETREVVSRKPYATDPACQRLVQVVDTREKPVEEAQLPAGAKIMVDVRGDIAWIQERKRYWHGRARVRTFATNERQSVVKESDGIGVAFKKFLDVFVPKFGTGKPLLESLSSARLGM